MQRSWSSRSEPPGGAQLAVDAETVREPVTLGLGVLADLTTMTRASPEPAHRTTLILAADDVPDSVVRDLSDAGVKTGDPQSLSDIRAGYDNEAYAWRCGCTC